MHQAEGRASDSHNTRARRSNPLKIHATETAAKGGCCTRSLITGLLRRIGHSAESRKHSTQEAQTDPERRGGIESEVRAVAVLVRWVAFCLAGFPLLFCGPLLDHQVRKQIGGEAVAGEDLRARERGMVDLLWLAFAGVPGGSV